MSYLMTDREKIFIAIMLIMIAGFAVYANSLNGKFICDDEFYIRDNIYIKSWSYIPNIFTENLGAGAAEKSNFYRPIQTITYMIDYFLWGLAPYGYHLTNTLLHVLVAWCIFWLVNILFNNKLLSLFTGILYVVHPIHTEAVAYISGRADSLAAIFMLLCFILYVKSLNLKRLSAYLLMLFSYVLALLSKENSLILPALLLLYHYVFKKRLKIKEFLPILFIALIYLLLRTMFLKEALTPTWRVTTSLFQRMPGFFVAITGYLRLLLLPFNLRMEYGNELFKLSDPQMISGAVTVIFLLAYAAGIRGRNALASFSITWFFLTLLPLSNLYPVNTYMAEHWLYLPSVGFFLALAKIFTKLYNSKKFKIIGLGLLICLSSFYSLLTVRQNNYWRDPIAFYERTLKYAQNNFRVYNNLGAAYFNIGKVEEAIDLFKKAIESKPDHPEAYNSLAVACYSKKQYGLAVKYCDKAIELGYKPQSGFLKLLEPHRESE